jgi:hypothetical protein
MPHHYINTQNQENMPLYKNWHASLFSDKKNLITQLPSFLTLVVGSPEPVCSTAITILPQVTGTIVSVHS